MANTGAIKRGFHYDEANSRLDLYVDGTVVCRFDPTNGLVPVVDGFDLSGQTITTVDASGSACYETMIAAYDGGAGAEDEGAKYALALKVDGTTYYIPAFTSVEAA
jgi:hypothetical protein